MHARTIVVIWTALAVAACAPKSPSPPPDSAAATHVGTAACAGCHPAEHEAWRGSHHDLAMQEATERTVRGDFRDATFRYAGVETRFYERDGSFRVRTDGPDGELREYRIAYTFGVEPLQQYLVAMPDGRIQALGIAWDTRPREEGGGRWFHLYPDERVDHTDVLHWTGPLQNWNYMCAECHSTAVRKNYRAEEDRFETEWFEIDVSCEACHGPGSEHAATPEVPLPVGRAEDGRWVLDQKTGLARREPPRGTHVEIETCARCHSRRTMLSEGYVHGRPLAETHRPSLLTEPLYHADGQILDEVYVYGSFLQSKMYRAGVTCTDCHDPHGLGLRASGNGVCSPCHLATRFDTPGHHHHEAGTEGALCVSCHMPSRNYMVVDPRRDHGFRVPRPDLTVKIGTPNACNGCHEDQSAGWAKARVAGWYGTVRSERPHFAETIHAGRRGEAGAGRALAALAADPASPGIVRATALSLLGDNPGPELASAVRRAVMDGDVLVRLAAAEVATRLEPATRAAALASLLSDSALAVRTAAASALAAVPRESLPEESRLALDPAIEEYRAVQELNADRPEAHVNLGALSVTLGDLGGAESEYRKAIALEPRFVAAYVNLADLYRQLARDEEGERVLRDGLALVPGAADLHHALGLALIRQGRREDGVASLRRAHELAPDNARYAYVLGVALSSTGDREEAIRVLSRAHERRTGDRDILAALVAICRDAGKPELSDRYARTLAALQP